MKAEREREKKEKKTLKYGMIIRYRGRGGCCETKRREGREEKEDTLH